MDTEWNTFVKDPEGRIAQISPSGGRFYLSCIHPQGTNVVCQGGLADEPLRIWLFDVASKCGQPLSPAHMMAQSPAFSWDGRRVVFSAIDLDRCPWRTVSEIPVFLSPQDILPMALYLVDVNGDNLLRLTSGDNQDIRATFSPDGTMLAYVSNWRLFTLDLAEGAEPMPIAGSYPWAMRPWYSRDGQTLFFHSEWEGRHRICRYDLATQAISPLQGDDRGMSHGSFALPNEDAILMHSNRDGTWRIWKVPLDGSMPVEIPVPGFKIATHATQSRDGALAFDSPESPVLP